jgi:hypothetical protein
MAKAVPVAVDWLYVCIAPSITQCSPPEDGSIVESFCKGISIVMTELVQVSNGEPIHLAIWK